LDTLKTEFFFGICLPRATSAIADGPVSLLQCFG